MHEVIFTKGKRVICQKCGCVWGNGIFACITQSWTTRWLYCCDCTPWQINIKIWSFVKSHLQATGVDCISQCPNIPPTRMAFACHCKDRAVITSQNPAGYYFPTAKMYCKQKVWDLFWSHHQALMDFFQLAGEPQLWQPLLYWTIKPGYNTYKRRKRKSFLNSVSMRSWTQHSSLGSQA